MLIHLKRNEKLYVNGAVIRLDRRGSIELMNDAQFLLEGHVMQADDATTPLRQIYFVVQMMLIDPDNAHLTSCLFATHVEQLRKHATTRDYHVLLDDIEAKVNKSAYFEALKSLRKGFAIDDLVLNRKPASAETAPSHNAKQKEEAA